MKTRERDSRRFFKPKASQPLVASRFREKQAVSHLEGGGSGEMAGSGSRLGFTLSPHKVSLSVLIQDLCTPERVPMTTRPVLSVFLLEQARQVSSSAALCPSCRPPPYSSLLLSSLFSLPPFSDLLSSRRRHPPSHPLYLTRRGTLKRRASPSCATLSPPSSSRSERPWSSSSCVR